MIFLAVKPSRVFKLEQNEANNEPQQNGLARKQRVCSRLEHASTVRQQTGGEQALAGRQVMSTGRCWLFSEQAKSRYWLVAGRCLKQIDRQRVKEQPSQTCRDW